jgi:hypothetical protein
VLYHDLLQRLGKVAQTATLKCYVSQDWNIEGADTPGEWSQFGFLSRMHVCMVSTILP